jgi:transposase-like protein
VEALESEWEEVVAVKEGGVPMKGRKWTAEEKLAIVLEGIKGGKPVAEICREHRIAQAQYYLWRDRFLEGGKRALMSGGVEHRGGVAAQDREA